MIAQYSEVKRESMPPHTGTPAGGDYSVLKRGDIPNVPLHDVTAGGDYSLISRDDIPYGAAAGGEHSVLKREDREVS